jgi:hypothetical protein
MKMDGTGDYHAKQVIQTQKTSITDFVSYVASRKKGQK